MRLLGIAAFCLALLCVGTVGEDDTPINNTSATIPTSTSKSAAEAVNTMTSKTTTSPTTVLAVTEMRSTTGPTTSHSTSSSPSAIQQTTQNTTSQPPLKVTTAAADKNDSTTITAQANGRQLAHNESLSTSPTKEWSFSSTTSLVKTTSAPENSSLQASSPTISTNFSSPGSSSGNKKTPGSEIHYSSIILPIVITLIVTTLSVFSLVALYRMCQKKTPERQENGTEQAQSDKEGVKLLSVKTTSAETVFVEVRDIFEVGFSLPSANLSEPTTPPPSGEVSQGRTTGEHSSQGKNKTRQLFTPQQ